MLTVVTASTGRSLTTVAALKSLTFGATASATGNDAYLADIIARASRFAETYIGFDITLQSYEETVAGFGSRRLMLSRTPITAVDHVYDNSGDDTGTMTEVLSTEFKVEDRDAGFLSRNQGWPWSALMQGHFDNSAIPLEPAPSPNDETRPWLVDYRAGWTYGGIESSSPNWSTQNGTTSTGRTLPDDIEQAVLIAAQEMFENRNDVQSERLGDLGVSYGVPGGASKPTSYERLLDPYRRMTP